MRKPLLPRTCRYLLAFAFAFASSASAAVLTVTTTADAIPGPAGSLRKALIDANEGDTIEFAPAVSGAIALQSPLYLPKNVTITGPGASVLAINQGFLGLPAGKTASISGLTLRNGSTLVNEGTLQISQCVFANNLANGNSPSIGQPGTHGGAIRNTGSLTIADTVFRSNRAGDGGFGYQSTPPGMGGNGGAIAHLDGTLVITGSVFEANRAGDASATVVDPGNSNWPQSFAPPGQGGAIYASKPFTITDCRFLKNEPGRQVVLPYRGSGGAISYAPGAVVGAAQIRNSTFQENEAQEGGAVYFNTTANALEITNSTFFGNRAASGGAIFAWGSLSLTSSTITGNTALAKGGGLLQAGGSSFTLRNSIVAGNSALQGSEVDVLGSYTSGGYNLIGVVQGSTGFAAGQNHDLIGTTAAPLLPGLGQPAENGGLTSTIVPLAGSPALDAGDDTLTGTDQRGLPRLAGTHVDIGAVERDAAALVSFNTASSTVSESATAHTINVTRTGSTLGTATVQYFFRPAAVAPASEADFSGLAGTLTFQDGETTKPISFTTTLDGLTEADEYFEVVLYSPSATNVGPIGQHLVKIAGETPAISVSLTQANVSMTEGETITLIFDRTGDLSQSLGISYNVIDGSTSASDWVRISSPTVYFSAGSSQVSIQLRAADDGAIESPETLVVQLQRETPNTLLGPIATTTVTILDNDSLPRVRTVTNLTDSSTSPSAGSLRKVIQESSSGDTIQFSPGLTGTISLFAPLVIDRDLTITGPGAEILKLDGRYQNRIFTIQGNSVTISGLTLQNGKTSNQSHGGAIYNEGFLTLHQCVLTDNASSDRTLNFPGHYYTPPGSGGAIFNAGGTIQATRTSFLRNHTFRNPQGYLDGQADGGAIYSSGGSISLSECLVEDNDSSRHGGGIYVAAGSCTVSSTTIRGNRSLKGAAIYHQGSLTINQSTFDHNEGTSVVELQSGSATLTSSTFSSNGLTGSTYTISTKINATITSCTVADNIGFGVVADLAVTLRNTIVARNTTDLTGAFTSLGHNLIGKLTASASGIMGGSNGDLAGTEAAPLDARLGILADNGGRTRTHALLGGSPAIDAGDDALTASDQRGQARPVGAHVDIGAFERTQATFTFTSAASSVAETAGTHLIVVTRASSSGLASVQYQFTPLTASTADFTGLNGALSFADGETVRMITVPIINDDLVEPNETFSITLNTGSPNELGAEPIHTISIQSEDTPSTFSFSAATLSVAETVGTINLTVVCTSGNTPANITVRFVNGSAKSGLDWNATDITLGFGSGTTQRTVPVQILQDGLFEGLEDFTAVLQVDGVNTLAGANPTQVISIVNTDPPTTFSFASANSTVAENAGSATIVVTRTGNTRAQEVYYTLNQGTALRPSDFTGASGTLIFASGEMQKIISVPIVDDNVVESPETFTVVLTPDPAYVLGATATHTVTIISDDVAPVFAFKVATSQVSEAAGSVNVTVVRSGNTQLALPVSYALQSGTAIASFDFLVQNNFLEFASGETEKTITVPIINDTTVEGPETFTIQLITGNTGSTLGTPNAHVVTIESDDVGPVFAFSTAASTVSETTESVTVTLVRSGDLQAALTVSYATSNGTATAGSDYTAQSGTFSFAAGETQRTITIPIWNDNRVEGPETFTVQLTAVGSGGGLGGISTHTVTIESEDEVSFALVAPSAAVEESAGTASVTVLRSGPTGESFTVQYATMNGSAIAGTDYTAASGTLTFGPNDTSKTITVALTDDTTAEEDKSFQVTLSNPTGGATLGTPNSVSVTIADDDGEHGARKASYHGLANEVGGTSLGGVRVNTTVTNRLTATVQVLGKTFRFSSAVSSTGAFSQTIVARPWGERITCTLTGQVGSSGKRIQGTLNIENHPTFNVLMERDADEATPRPTATRFTAILDPTEGGQAPGYLTATIGPKGTVKLSGSLPDGTALAASTVLTYHGHLPFYILRYPKAAGYVGGNTQFHTGPGFGWSGDLVWRRPATGRGAYPAGFEARTLQVSGESFTPSKNMRIMDDLNDSVINGYGTIMRSGGQSQPMEVKVGSFYLDTHNRVTGLQTARARLSFNVNTGIFTGSFPYVNGKSRAFRGIVVQGPGAEGDIAEGYFLDEANPGTVTIVPGL